MPGDPLDVLFENDDLAVIDKPAGMVVTRPTDTAAARWSMRCWRADLDRDLGRAGARGDRPPAGRNVGRNRGGQDTAALETLRSIQKRAVENFIRRWSKGHPTRRTASSMPHRARSPPAQRMAVARDGREAVTEFHDRAVRRIQPREVFPRLATYQIRVHLAFIGHPVVAIRSGGNTAIKMKRHFLHAAAISFAARLRRIVTVDAAPVPLQTSSTSCR